MYINMIILSAAFFAFVYRYIVVGTFFVQSEQSTSIAEALNILQQWNPKWHPRCFMVNICEGEIKGVELSFSGNNKVFDILYFLLNFHILFTQKLSLNDIYRCDSIIV